MARRLYLGRLPTDARSEDVNKFFEGYGRIVDCRVMTEDAVHQLNGKSFMGTSIVVEFAKESRPRRDPYDDRGYGAPRSRRPPGIRLLVTGVSRDTSWQDLKDFGRDAGSVSFADIDRDVPGQGILEYLNRDDADRAVRELDGKELRGRPVRVAFDDSRAGPDNYRRDTRRDDRRDERRDDRYREDRYRTTKAIVGTVPGRLVAPPTMMIVDPGLLPPEERLMIEGLQGTMITGVGAMMIAKALTIMMIVAGMNAETTENATIKKNATTIGLQGKRMGMEDGPVEWTR
ncbi:hypothetical protein C0995_007192 [Termitomyces sp. Mi166|nr:hypothetical protein C0995_007192 [Termitomyces sp. Mi166\